MKTVISGRGIKPGTRVRLRSSSHALALASDTGTVTRPDEWEGYFVIRLDQPAQYRHADGRTETLPEIVELADNLEILPSQQ